MRRRIGNDIPVEVEILRNGKAEDMDLLQSFDIQIKSRNGAVMPFEYLLEGNKAKGTFYGKDQLETGPYLIVLVENGGLNGMATVDAELVTLVDRTYKENIDDEDATVCVSFSVVTDGEYVSAHFSAVRDGLSAYEIAVLNGFAGTVEEWLESLKGPQGPQGDKMTYADLTQEDKEDIYAGGAQILKPLLDAKANLQHQHTVADITDFPELYYDATAFFASAYPSDKYEELLEAVKAKKTVYATIDEEGYVSYVFFMSSANNYGSSSRVLLTTIFADGDSLYMNTFVLEQSGMTPLQESITGKANKATTLAGYGIADAYTKSEVNAALNTKQDTLSAGEGISLEGNEISTDMIAQDTFVLRKVLYLGGASVIDGTLTISGATYNETTETITI